MPFQGRVVWLTPEQGGRTCGPATGDPETGDYAATAYLPPQNAESGLASFVLRITDPGAWISLAEGAWLVPQDDPAFTVAPGAVLVITEGPQPVAYFHVAAIH
ncbi:hypothetical protein Q0Z83_032460 [Actinoplanes sichuanensis]|nr:hypothetical protein Q0Z83_032460 [Actinoplanes sichuanensis]